MKKFKGIGVFGAYALGEVSIFKRRKFDIEKLHISDIDAEKARLQKAKKLSVKQLKEIYEKALYEVGKENAEIFKIHAVMVEDIYYNESINKTIEKESVNAEYAVSTTGEAFIKMFDSMDDTYIKARAADIKDVTRRILRNLMSGTEHTHTTDEKVIICSDDLVPSETVMLDREKLLAFVTAYGSTSSHTAILARNMNIPAIVGVGDEFLSTVKDGDFAIVDGYSGEILLNPDEKAKSIYLKKQAKDIEKKHLLQKLKGKDNVTIDGKRINIFANIGGVKQLDSVIESDAGGIGLFRSEYLYLQSSEYPTEEDQFIAYKSVLEGMNGKKVIIRTLDIGADKKVGYFNLDKEDNPALGYRAIRICLTRPEIFKTQLRALYRASYYGNLGIMFPMITSVWEVKKILSICKEVKSELKAENIPYSKSVELGIMIETPAAAMISDLLAPLVDFFSIGTNDLTQYSLACDRQNAKVDEFVDTHHESILRFIKLAAENAHKNGAWIGICGELAADTTLTKTFLEMGIDELSVSPAFVLKLRDVVRKTELSKSKNSTPKSKK